jgi:hypothetical protein
MTAKQFIKRYDLIESPPKKPVHTLKRVYRFSGSNDSYNYREVLSDDWEEVTEWADGAARVVWINRGCFSILTYCEGDVTLVICDCRPKFDTELKELRRQYAE